MFGKFAEQVKQSSKPVSELVTVNAKALESISKQQTAFFTGVLSDSVSFLQNASKQTKLNGYLAAQSAYSESVRDRFTTVSSSTLSTLTAVREDLSKVVKDSLSKSASKETKTPTATAVTVTKKATPTKATAAKSAASKPKVAAKKPAAPKAAAKKPVKPIVTVEKPATSEEVKATPSAEPVAKAVAETVAKPVAKSAAKPVAKPKAKTAATTRKTTRKPAAKSTASKAQS